MGPLVVARRWDQLGSRLNAIVNARCLAERFDLPFAFVWPRGNAAQLFDATYLDEFEIEEAALSARAPVSQRDLLGRSEDDARRFLEEAGPDAVVDVDETFGICAFSESGGAATRRFRRCFEEMGWNGVVRGLISSSSFAAGAHGLSGVHVRAGDIVDGEWRHLVAHEKYAPTPYVEHAIERLSAGGGQVAVMSDNRLYLSWLDARFPAVVTAEAMVPGYEALTGDQRSLADLLVLSGCRTVVGSRRSAFSRLATNLGGGRPVLADELVAAGEELDVLRLGIQRRLPDAREPGFWRPLVARDLCWCADVFADALTVGERRGHAHLAVGLEPDFGGAAALEARMAAMDCDFGAAHRLAERALAVAETVEAHPDPLVEALATDVAVRCLGLVAGSPPARAAPG